MSALPLAIPAAAAGLAYLNARHGISHDTSLFFNLFRTARDLSQNQRANALNLFYQLKSHATSTQSHDTWIIFQGQSWTYAQAYDIILRYGAWLRTRGVEKNDIVAIDFVNSEKFLWIWFGLWSIGAKPAFINYNLTGKPLVHTIKTSTARLVLVDEEGKDKLRGDMLTKHGFISLGENKYSFERDADEVPRSVRNQTNAPQSFESATLEAKVPYNLEIIPFDKNLHTQILASPPTRQPDESRAGQTPTSMAMLIYTSGTTGLPKPAVMAWGKCNGGASFVPAWLGLKKSDVIYTSMPLYHSSASVLGVCAALRAGSAICLSRKFSHKTFWPEVVDSEATILHYVGETCRYLLSAPTSPLDKKHKLRGAFGNGLRPDVWEPFKTRFNIPTIYEFYAATEAPGGLWNRSSNRFSSGAIGRNGTLSSLLASRSMVLVRMDPEASPPAPFRDARTGLCQVSNSNEPGELLYRLDPNNPRERFQGYFNNAGATSSKILRDVTKRGDAWFRSGDLMRLDKEGRWWWVDRLGDTFRWKAENVSTAEVADVLGKHEAVEEACVYGVQVPGHDGRAGCAAIVLKVERGPSEHTLIDLAEHIKKELPSFAQPVWLRFTKSLQTTGTNKQQKHVLQEEGIDLSRAEQKGDIMFWLRGGRYVKFDKMEHDRLEGGGVKL